MISSLIVLSLEGWDLRWLFTSARNVSRLLKLYVSRLSCGHLARFWATSSVSSAASNTRRHIPCCGSELKCKTLVPRSICSLWMRPATSMLRFMLACNVLVFVVTWLAFKASSIVRTVRPVMPIKLTTTMIAICVLLPVRVILFGVDILFSSLKSRIGSTCLVFFMAADNPRKKASV